ncbi:uncharacterized protein BP5553_09285 [Venustampulla echinocandica]|uniref:Uncharacterized protein n=1 Tax=Venustampulla echinocandica TaxID=2656787 RepID=A0A370TCA5_9HELO|nr:uncharacterized protein BP5553_09285 [Venustampulla echinocandica]RDL31883.1 hypothetical protein BP5553_09285 [Venustampulla echinocandica]
MGAAVYTDSEGNRKDPCNSPYAAAQPNDAGARVPPVETNNHDDEYKILPLCRDAYKALLLCESRLIKDDPVGQQVRQTNEREYAEHHKPNDNLDGRASLGY